MTNKEAATIVKRIRYYMEGSECWTDAEFIAMDMAVKALSMPSAQPELTDEDMKLIKQMRSYHNGSYAKVIDKLLAVASAQPKRLIWEQKIKKASIHRYGNDVCCTILDHALNRTFGYKFCPECGERLILKIEKQKGGKNENW